MRKTHEKQYSLPKTDHTSAHTSYDYGHCLWCVMTLFFTLFVCIVCVGEQVDINQAEARIRYAHMSGRVSVRVSATTTFRADNRVMKLSPGEYTIEVSAVQPAGRRYHVFPKTFHPTERQELDVYLNQWRARGYDPRIETFGLLYKTASGRVFDNRRHWVSLARFDSENEAQALINRLKEESVWAWRRAEKTTPGNAAFVISNAQGEQSPSAPAPLELRSDAPIEVLDMASSYWKNHKANRLLAGPLQFEIGMDGNIEIFGRLSVETYLRGVVPAEMPASWPMEALKAQAIVARSEIYASLADKYRLEGFDFTGLESCRAYWGIGGHHPRTDAAVVETSGQILVHEGAVAKTVFCASCGGLTENNENVWSGPANPLLRGVPDFPKNNPPAIGDMRMFIMSKPPAWCADDAGFRWQRRYSVQELSDLVNKHHRVGVIRSIEEGARGVSGRLKSVTINGSVGAATIERELAIRQVFGSLPSAMFVVEPIPSSTSPSAFLFYGGGRGHGVGMCQYGARGMANAGLHVHAILAHYFAGATIERTR